MSLTVRPATVGDLPAINDIYNHYVEHSTATFHETPLSHEQRMDWWRELDGHYPVLVGHAVGQIAGWAALAPYSGRCGYRFTVENSVYLREDCRGKGWGRKLLQSLLDLGAERGYHSVIAVIAAEQTVSIRLHLALGYQEVGRLREVGFKFGRRLDVVLLQKRF